MNFWGLQTGCIFKKSFEKKFFLIVENFVQTFSKWKFCKNENLKIVLNFFEFPQKISTHQKIQNIKRWKFEIVFYFFLIFLFLFWKIQKNRKIFEKWNFENYVKISRIFNFRKCLNKIFDDQKNIFSTIFFDTYILSEVLKNEFLWQSDHGLCHQTTVYRSRKFAKNQENLDILQWAPSYPESNPDSW